MFNRLYHSAAMPDGERHDFVVRIYREATGSLESICWRVLESFFEDIRRERIAVGRVNPPGAVVEE
jgi:hypothetical protein